MLCTCSALLAEIYNVSINQRPVDSSTCQLLHPLHAKMSQIKKMKKMQNLRRRNDYPGAIQEASMSGGERLLVYERSPK